MTIRLVDSGWAKELTDALRADASELKIICPLIKATALDRLLSRSQFKSSRASISATLLKAS